MSKTHKARQRQYNEQINEKELAICKVSEAKV
jgi:hypothetical protein